MPVRLSKALKDLNVGLSTAVEFLAKKGQKIDASPNYKLSDEQYMLLLKEFNKDMALKLEAEQLGQLRQAKEKGGTVSIEGYGETQKKEEDVVRVTLSEEQKPHLKPVGHIDLDAKPKKHERPEPAMPAPVAEEKPKEVQLEPEVVVAETPKEEPHVAMSVEPEPVVPAEPAETVRPAEPEKVTAEKEETAPVAPETVKTPEEPEVAEVEKPLEVAEPVVADKVEEKKEEKEEIFSLQRPVLEKTPVIIGKIDLDTINQSTRPKPKTKEQKRKEREEKNRALKEGKKLPVAQVGKKGGNKEQDEDKPKKKRERFIKQKVDVSKLGEQESFSKKTKAKEHAGFKRPVKNVVSEEDVQKQVKETLARLQGGGKKSTAKHRREKRETVHARMQEMAEKELQEKNVLKLTEFVTASELAVMMDVSVNEVIATCMSIGIMVSINQRLDAETINIVAEEFGFETEYVSHDVAEAIGNDEPDREEDLEPRAPIVTVMGHVDHGKTSLLDYIRKTNVIAGEAGGITQHIGAYNVTLENGQRITFLDTPGHEAFTAMRARGAKMTDIAIIIVAADDNVMPQTVEAINHASAANVPIVFAINKVDKPDAHPDKIKEELANMNYLVEEWGGKYQSQDISAKKGTGVDELLEKVLLEAELLDLKANPNRRAVGSVIESSLDKGRGYIATVLVENGTLHQGDIVLAGTCHGKVKAMFNERNQRIKSARPGEPVLILGLNGAPQAGDKFNVMPTEQEAREIANKREQLQREQSLRTKKHFTLDELGRRIALGDFKELNIIVKGDVDGSVEALSDSLLKLSTEHIQVNVIHKAVGAISDSDVLLAAASNAIICGFQVRPTATARKMAEKEEIDIRLYSIIYDAIEEIKSAMEGMLSPEIKEEVTATVEVLEVFKISKVGTVAGCLVREGKIARSNKVRLIRDGIVVYTGEISALKRFKDDVKEVGTNFECGVSIKNYNDIRVGDVIESFEETEVKKTL